MRGTSQSTDVLHYTLRRDYQISMDREYWFMVEHCIKPDMALCNQFFL